MSNKKRTKLSVFSTLAATALVFPPTFSHANPTGGQVVAGSATIRQETATKVGITQSTDKAIIDWQKYNIGAGEQVQYYQPSVSSVSLNRVVGQDPSRILGSLIANGRVFLVNPNGIFFGKDSRIDVAGLIATTHDIHNEDFMAGKYDFTIPGKPEAAVINEGTIHISDTGIAAFVAPSVANRGVIAAKLGKVALASANGFTLDFYGNNLLTFLIDDDVAKTAFDLEGNQLTSFVDNSGKIMAEGGYVLLTAKAAENAIHSVINQSGSIEATTVSTHKGEIILDAGKGSLAVSGTLDASAPAEGDGGFIETSGTSVSIAPETNISTKSATGENGSWLIDPYDFTIASSGGNVTGKALSGYLNNGNVTIQTATMGTAGGNGDIFINDMVSWSSGNSLTLQAERNVGINGSVKATNVHSSLYVYAPGTLTITGTGKVSAGNVSYQAGDANLTGSTTTTNERLFLGSYHHVTPLRIETGHTSGALSLSPTEISTLHATKGGDLNLEGSEITIAAKLSANQIDSGHLSLYSYGDIFVNAAIDLSQGELLHLLAARNITFKAPVNAQMITLYNALSGSGRTSQTSSGKLTADRLEVTGDQVVLDKATGGNSIGSIWGDVDGSLWLINGDQSLTVSGDGIMAGNIGLYTGGTLTINSRIEATGTTPISVLNPWKDPACTTGPCVRPHIELGGSSFVNNVGAGALTLPRAANEYWSLKTDRRSTTKFNGLVPDRVSYNADQINGDILLSANRVFYYHNDSTLPDDPAPTITKPDTCKEIGCNQNRTPYVYNLPKPPTNKELTQIGYHLLDKNSPGNISWEEYRESLLKTPDINSIKTGLSLEYPGVFGSDFSIDTLLKQILLAKKIPERLAQANNIEAKLKESDNSDVKTYYKNALDEIKEGNQAFDDGMHSDYLDALKVSTEGLVDALGFGYTGSKFVFAVTCPIPDDPRKIITSQGQFGKLMFSSGDFTIALKDFYAALHEGNLKAGINVLVDFAVRHDEFFSQLTGAANTFDAINNLISHQKLYNTVNNSFDDAVYGKVKTMTLDSITNAQLNDSIKMLTGIANLIGNDNVSTFVETIGSALDNFTDSYQRTRVDEMKKLSSALDGYNSHMAEATKWIGLAIQAEALDIGTKEAFRLKL